MSALRFALKIIGFFNLVISSVNVSLANTFTGLVAPNDILWESVTFIFDSHTLSLSESNF
jgi:hypothetical protein